MIAKNVKIKKVVAERKMYTYSEILGMGAGKTYYCGETQVPGQELVYVVMDNDICLRIDLPDDIRIITPKNATGYINLNSRGFIPTKDEVSVTF